MRTIVYCFAGIISAISLIVLYAVNPQFYYLVVTVFGVPILLRTLIQVYRPELSGVGEWLESKFTQLLEKMSHKSLSLDV